MNITLDTWIVSDTHFGHANIVRYCNRPEDHERIMVERWNKTVGPRDPILHLGDLAFWKRRDPLPRLNGDKYLIKGNHDQLGTAWYESQGFTIAPRKIWFADEIGQVVLTHEPIEEGEVEGWDVNIHGHIHNNGYRIDYNRSLDYRNVSVEVMDYTPVRLSEILHEHMYQGILDAPVDAWTKT